MVRARLARRRVRPRPPVPGVGCQVAERVNKTYRGRAEKKRRKMRARFRATPRRAARRFPSSTRGSRDGASR
jgi:hypothetical protein